MFFPNLKRALDVVRGFSRTHFPNPRAIFWQQRNQLRKIDISAKRRLMILRRPNAILHVTAKRARTDLAQPLGMIEKRDVLLDLDVTEVVPVADLRRI